MQILRGVGDVECLDAWESNQRLRGLLHHSSDTAKTFTEHIDREDLKDVADFFTARDSSDATLTLAEINRIFESVGHSPTDIQNAFLEREAQSANVESGPIGRIVFHRFLSFVVFGDAK